MSFLSKKWKAVAASVLVATASITQPQQAEAGAVGAAAAGAAAAMVIAEQQQHIRDVLSAVIAHPDLASIHNAVDAGCLDVNLLPYLAEIRAGMKLPPDLKAENVGDEQRGEFIRRLEEKRLVVQMTASAPEEAVKRGLSPDLAKYLPTAQKEAQIVPGQKPEDWEIEFCRKRLEEMHWHKDTWPKIVKNGEVAGGSAAALAVIATSATLAVRRFCY
jgi:hypothetical protein